MRYIAEDYLEEEPVQTEEYGCKFCLDQRSGKEKELYFFDPANNMRLCKFCPWCGRVYTA